MPPLHCHAGRSAQARPAAPMTGTPHLALRGARSSRALPSRARDANIRLHVTREALPMIYEFRTYTLHPRTLPEFLKRWVPMIEKRQTLFEARGLLVHRDRAAQSGHPRVALRECAGAQQDPRGRGQGQGLAAPDQRVHRRDEVGDLRAAALLAAHGAVQRRPLLRDAQLHAAGPAASPTWPSAGRSTCPAAPSCRR